MIFSPAILALLGASLVGAIFLLPAAAFAVDVVRNWDLASGSEQQLIRERRTYLVSSLLVLLFINQLAGLILFVHTTEGLSDRFVGAMCATGVLGVNPWGWPTLFLKIALFFAGAVWLMLNRLDNRSYDYPLARIKYGLLLALVPLALAEVAVQLKYFMGMEGDIITSCCGSLFTPEADGVAGGIAFLPPATALVVFYAGGALAMGACLWCLLPATSKRLCGLWLAGGGMMAFLTGIAGIVSIVAPYIYETPHHHCPFCILKVGYGSVGYWLYIPLFAATAFALGAGAISHWRTVASLHMAAVADVRSFSRLAMALFLMFYAIASLMMMRSNLIVNIVQQQRCANQDA